MTIHTVPDVVVGQTVDVGVRPEIGIDVHVRNEEMYRKPSITPPIKI